jgi:hypothetical protein
VRHLEAPAAGLPLGPVYAGLLVLTLALGALWLAQGFPLPGCPFRGITGLVCPTCGSTRLVRALLQGDLVRAFLSNPLVFLTGAAVGLWAVVSLARRLLGRPYLRIVLSRREGHALRLAAVAALLLGWGYLLWRGA